MTKTLLDGVNETLKRVGVIDSYNIGLLTSLTSSAQQREIDLSVQIINEGIDELFRGKGDSPNKSAESTIVLVTGQREYSLASNLITLKWPMTDRVNTQYIAEWEGNYEEFLLLDPQQLYTGIPTWAMISPINGNLRLDRAPDSTVNGYTYYYEYNKNTVLVNATDTMPFNDEAFRSMVPVWAQLYSRERKKEFDQALYQQGLGRAAYSAREVPARTTYDPR